LRGTTERQKITLGEMRSSGAHGIGPCYQNRSSTTVTVLPIDPDVRHAGHHIAHVVFCARAMVNRILASARRAPFQASQDWSKFARDMVPPGMMCPDCKGTGWQLVSV
jgi:hypothetical protein